MKFKKVSRKEFYRRFKNINWGDIEDVELPVGPDLLTTYYIPERKIHYKLEAIPGVINDSGINEDGMLHYGPEDTIFHVEMKSKT